MSRPTLRAEYALNAGLHLLGLGAAAVLLVVIGFVAHGAAPVLHTVGWLRFFTDPDWHPTEGAFNLVPMLTASLASSLGALLLAVPAGVAAAVFCRYLAPRGVAATYRRALGVFTGIPSVVYGFWGLTVLVPFIAEHRPPGASLMAGILILALMILPTVALTSEAALAQVPPAYLAGAHALGLSPFLVIARVALPAAGAGITAGTVLALARALGETMAVLMVSGNIVAMPTSLFDPVRTLAANIALEMAYALGDHRSALFVSGALLVGVVGSLMLLSQRLIGEPHG